MSQDFGHALLNEWLFQKDLTFLNHGAYGAVPRPVLSAQHSWREELERQPVNFINNRLEAMLHDAAKDLATFVGHLRMRWCLFLIVQKGQTPL